MTLPDGRRILVDIGESPRRPECGTPCRTWHKRVIDDLYTDLDGDAIDLLWVTHQHSDHHGGLPGLAMTYPDTRITHYVDNGTLPGKPGVKYARKAAAKLGAALHEVSPGHTDIPIANTPEVQLNAIVPRAWPHHCSDPNECSIGLQISYCHSKILFTGDAGRAAERVWPVGDISLLQVGHHGSKTSSSEKFIDKVKPEYAVFSSGKRDEGPNKTYCHPLRATVDRLSAAVGGPTTKSAELFDTSVNNCRNQTPEDWVALDYADHVWLTAYEGTVRLQTTGDGIFTEVAAGGEPGTGDPNGLTNINTATKSELDALPGIGPVKAQAIIDYRDAHGAFVTTSELDSVVGIGPATMRGLVGLIVA